MPRAVPLPSAKIFWKNSATFLCRGPWLEALGKDFSKKKNNSLPRAPGDGPRQRLRPRRRRRDGCFSLPSAAPALGKGFAECPIKGPRQRPSSPTQNSPRALCRGLMGLCRGPQALGKEAVSSSAPKFIQPPNETCQYSNEFVSTRSAQPRCPIAHMTPGSNSHNLLVSLVRSVNLLILF